MCKNLLKLTPIDYFVKYVPILPPDSEGATFRFFQITLQWVPYRLQPFGLARKWNHHWLKRWEWQWVSIPTWGTAESAQTAA